MYRGQQLYNKLNGVQKKGVITSKKGRNEGLLNDRNICLLHRYYYYSKIARFSYLDVIPALSREFFLSERTVVDIVTKNNSELKAIYKQQPSVNELQHKFLFYNWKIN